MQTRALSPVKLPVALSLYQIAAVAILSLGTLFLLLQAALSLQWPLVHDTAFLHGVAYQINHFGLVPYRDIHETTLPLGILTHVMLTRAVGYGDFAFRVVDVAYLGALLFVTYRVMRPLGRLVAWAAALTFGLLYQSYGPMMAMQRDYLALLPVAAAIWLGGRSQYRSWHFVAIGALFGLAASIKPHFVIGLPPVLIYALAARGRPFNWQHPDWPALLRVATLTGIGGVAAAAPPVLWVWRAGGLAAFRAIFSDYLPLYNQLTGNREILGPREYYIYLFLSAQHLGGQAALLLPAAFGVYIELTRGRLKLAQRRLVLLLATLTPLYVIYVIIAGKFWTYHWIPFFYFAVCCGALVLRPLQEHAAPRKYRIPALVVFAAALLLTVRPAPDIYRQLSGRPVNPAAGGRPALAADFLRDQLQPGDSIQPIDGIGGGSGFALMRLGAPLATPYFNRTAFYHHVSTDTVQAYRRDFLARLQEAPPRFITDSPLVDPPSGVDSDDFPALKQFIAQHYRVALAQDGLVVYERIDSSFTAVE